MCTMSSFETFKFILTRLIWLIAGPLEFITFQILSNNFCLFISKVFLLWVANIFKTSVSIHKGTILHFARLSLNVSTLSFFFHIRQRFYASFFQNSLANKASLSYLQFPLYIVFSSRWRREFTLFFYCCPCSFNTFIIVTVVRAQLG